MFLTTIDKSREVGNDLVQAKHWVVFLSSNYP